MLEQCSSECARHVWRDIDWLVTNPKPLEVLREYPANLKGGTRACWKSVGLLKAV
jgi:hypothetical protein